ncbi:DNA repair protein RecN [Pseudoroseicyclus tamaricis]|uniref:DNA repair protein RecN n=1 Tax=Pseudoroseicyclus tamaricis TaxID=2705421 RepID=A0A6B2JZL6_9RHOB|nr:DNA repair protein RecN [Pseudoroseicyclus tamaricis]NDV01704.1 DNA repair protein RecN [Pseudoroseicyclus tamaricis]
MLRQLDITDMLLIRRAELSFGPGLNVLTGETGAGKSILLDSLGFALGWRGRAELVRQGAEKGEVVAIFELGPGHPACAVLEEAGIDFEDELILRRVNTPSGRKSAWVNDRPASGELLRRLSEHLVELHGQGDDRALLDPRSHLALLDAFADAQEPLVAVRMAWSSLRATRKALAEAEARAEALREEEEYLRHAAAEIEELSPQPGEEEALDTARRSMQAGVRIREDIARAHAALAGDAAEGLTMDAIRWLEGAAEAAEGRLDAPLEALSRAVDALGEAEQGVAEALDALNYDPSELERTEERLFALRALARKHGLSIEELPALGQDLSAKLEALDASEGDIDTLRREVSAAEEGFESAATHLSGLRRAAATRLEAAMATELPPLKLERARFTVQIDEAPGGPTGLDMVRFAAATNPGAPAGPLEKVASGGELSRFLLALKVCLHAGAEGQILIFDEIDRGVGGATADAIGRRLSRLAESGQVLVVTHSPQVAARGAHHFRVRKEETDGGAGTLSQVAPLAAAERVEEIARMLAGADVTAEAKAAAEALIGTPPA